MMRVASRVSRAALGMLSPSGSRGRLMILAFHQVPEQPDSIRTDVPNRAVFALQMEWLADLCNVLPLPEAAERLLDGTLPSRAACITFDDGYADNLEVAAPILKRLGLPATFFITAAAVERGIMWNDLVIEGIRRAGDNLDLQDIGFGHRSLVGDDARRAAIHAVIAELKYRPLAERMSIAEHIFSRAADEAPPRLMMTVKQVAELGSSGFDIGAHTMNHPILKRVPPDVASREIAESGDWVASVVGKSPTSFAYPNGRPGRDFSLEHEDMVRKAGFSVAVSTHWASATSASSRFSLPRITPWERQRSGFCQRLVKTAALSYIGS